MTDQQRERTLSEQGLDDAIGEAFFEFYNGLDSAKCVHKIRDAFRFAGYTRPAEPSPIIASEVLGLLMEFTDLESPEINKLADKISRCLSKHSPDRVESIAKLLYFKAGGDGWEKEPDKRKHYLDLGKEQFRNTAREILKLSVPELTGEEITHILETQELLCQSASQGDDDGSCPLCNSIKAKLAHDQQTIKEG